MKDFLNLKQGITIDQTENILGRRLNIEKRRERYFNSDIVHFEDMGVWLFFKPDTGLLYTIRYEAPFHLAIDGISIGDRKDVVLAMKGIASRIDPFPAQTHSVWIYGETGEPDWVRFDFDPSRNGKCITIFK